MPQQGRDEGLARFEYVFDISMQAPKDGELFQRYDWEWRMEHVDVSWLKTCQTKIAVDRMCHFRRFLHRTPRLPRTQLQLIKPFGPLCQEQEEKKLADGTKARNTLISKFLFEDSSSSSACGCDPEATQTRQV